MNCSSKKLSNFHRKNQCENAVLWFNNKSVKIKFVLQRFLCQNVFSTMFHNLNCFVYANFCCWLNIIFFRFFIFNSAMRWLLLSPLFVLCAHGLFEDQIGKFDWLVSFYNLLRIWRISSIKAATVRRLPLSSCSRSFRV